MPIDNIVDNILERDQISYYALGEVGIRIYEGEVHRELYERELPMPIDIGSVIKDAVS